MNEVKIYKAGLYYRLSIEDRDVSRHEKEESDSIANQKNLIRDFLKNKKDIEIVNEYKDDGVSGSSFSRPAFNKMMNDIELGIIDCVVVKDLSRFGREYIDAGNLLERVFPSLGVRFIAINDNVDTINGMDSLTVSLKNIMNDAYCRDISIKIRSNLEVKRNHGEFIGSFAVYGYEKNPKNKNELIIDNYASTVVNRIFMWKIQGMSCSTIAKKLNTMGVYSPYEYKMNQGLLYTTVFKKKEKCIWEACTVRRILENEIYTGTLVQGKWTTANHKIKKNIKKDEKQWVRVENCHEAIVTKRDYELVQKSLKLDTRTAPGMTTCYPLSGIMICAECGSNMVRRARRDKEKVYVYYECLEHSTTGKCSNHNIREERVEEIVLETIKSQINLMIQMDECLKHLDLTMLTKMDQERLDKQIKVHSADVIKYKGLSKYLYEDLKEGIILKEDYLELKDEFEIKRREAEKALLEAQKELEQVKNHSSVHYKWVEYFTKYKNIKELTRTVVLELIDQIVVVDKKHVEITLAYQDEFNEACGQIERFIEEQNIEKDNMKGMNVNG